MKHRMNKIAEERIGAWKKKEKKKDRWKKERQKEKRKTEIWKTERKL